MVKKQITVLFPDDLVREMDLRVNELNYTSRTEYVRDLVRKRLAKSKAEEGKK